MASPTAARESITLTCIVNAMEERDGAMIGIPNAFVQTDQAADETATMKMRGRLAELMVTAAPETYRKHVIYENGKKVSYVKLLKALYGTLKAALPFHPKLVKDLESQGFEINPYDPCVANKMVNGEQLTAAWHVNDMKKS